MTKEREKALEQENQELQATLAQERTAFAMAEYEMLKRLYPYLANEVEGLRQQNTQLRMVQAMQDSEQNVADG